VRGELVVEFLQPEEEDYFVLSPKPRTSSWRRRRSCWSIYRWTLSFILTDIAGNSCVHSYREWNLPARPSSLHPGELCRLAEPGGEYGGITADAAALRGGYQTVRSLGPSTAQQTHVTHINRGGMFALANTMPWWLLTIRA